MLTDNEFELMKMKEAEMGGVMVDVWWGVVEAKGPKMYEWDSYRLLFKMIQEVGLKLQVVMSSTQTGVCSTRNQEYLTLGVDYQCLFHGRTCSSGGSTYQQSFLPKLGCFCENSGGR